MSLINNWIVAIIVQQDGQHCFEYTDLELSILAQPQFEHIKYKIFYYDQPAQTAVVRQVNYNETTKVADFMDITPVTKVDLYKEETLVDFFKQQIFSMPEEDHLKYRYMVISWGHGAGLGYFGNIVDDPNAPDIFAGTDIGSMVPFSTKKNEYKELMHSVSLLSAHLPGKKHDVLPLLQQQLATDKISLSPETVTILDNRLQLITAGQFAAILKQSLPKETRIDVLITNTCYTQLIETGYALKDSVSLLISPQTTIPFTGLNYKELFGYMETNSGLSLAELARKAKDSFAKKYETEPFKSTFRILRPYPYSLMGEVSFSANYLKYYQEFMDDFFDPLAEQFLHIVGKLTFDQIQFDLIVSARKHCLDITPTGGAIYGIIDLTHFFREFVRLNKEKGITRWDPFLKKFETLRKKIIASWYEAQDPAIYQPGNEGASISPYFLSVFFPYHVSSTITNFLLQIYLTAPTAAQFPANNSKWPLFIDRMANHLTLFPIQIEGVTDFH